MRRPSQYAPIVLPILTLLFSLGVLGLTQSLSAQESSPPASAEGAASRDAPPDPSQNDPASPDQSASENSTGENTAAKTPTELAKPHYQDGVAAFAAGEYELAEQELKEAVRLDPKYVDAHYKLGATYYQLRQLGSAWRRFRLALTLDPQHKASLIGHQKFWEMFAGRGQLDVGQSPRQVSSALGQPDSETVRGNHRRWTYNHQAIDFLNDRLYSVMDTRDFSREKAAAEARIEFGFDGRRWTTVSRDVSYQQVIVRYMPPGQSSANWRERVSIQRALGHSRRGRTAQMFVKSIELALRQQQPNLQWNVIEDGTNDLVFEWYMVSLDKQGSKTLLHTIARAMGGPKDIHLVSYSRRGPRMDSTERSDWIQRLKDAKLVELKKADE